MNQGDVYWYRFRAPDKRRPVLVLTRDSAIPHLTSVTVAPITSTLRGLPTEVMLTEDDGMPGVSAVNVDNLQTVQKSNVGNFITHLTPTIMRDVRTAIQFAFGFESLD